MRRTTRQNATNKKLERKVDFTGNNCENDEEHACKESNVKDSAASNASNKENVITASTIPDSVQIQKQTETDIKEQLITKKNAVPDSGDVEVIEQDSSSSPAKSSCDQHKQDETTIKQKLVTKVDAVPNTGDSEDSHSASQSQNTGSDQLSEKSEIISDLMGSNEEQRSVDTPINLEDDALSGSQSIQEISSVVSTQVSSSSLSRTSPSLKVYTIGAEGVLQELDDRFKDLCVILQKADLFEYLQNFVDLDYHDRSLKYIKDQDLKDLFQNKRGDMCIFRDHLEEFLENASESDIPPSALDESSTKKTSEDPLLYFSDVHESIDIRTILKGDKILGKPILMEGKSGRKLSAASCKNLTQVVVKYLCNKNIWLEKADFNHLWLKIKAVFKEENQCDYFDGKTGYLFNHFHNQVKEFRKKNAYPQKNKHRKVEAKDPKPSENAENENLVEPTVADLNWLKANSENWTIYESKWKKFASARCGDYLKKTFPEIIARWPMLGNVNFSKELIDLDFQYLYNGKVNLFEERYQFFCDFVKENKIKEFHLSEDEYEVDIFKLLHYLLPPTMFSEVLTEGEEGGVSKPRWSRKKQYPRSKLKFSRESSFKSCFLTIDFKEKFEKIVKDFAEEKKKMKLHFHPVMGGTKNNEGVINGFVLYMNGLIIKSKSFKDILLLYLESFHIFDFVYPTEGRLVCEMLSYALLDIEVSSQACKTARDLGNRFLDYLNALPNKKSN